MLINLECPVELLKYNLYKSKSSGEIYCSITFNNLSKKVVQAIKAKLYCYNEFNELIKDSDNDYIEVDIRYGDGLQPNTKQEIDKKILLNNVKDTKKIEIDVEAVLFNDNSTWNKGSSVVEKVKLNKITDQNILSFVKENIGTDAKYISQSDDEKWSCICGRFNYQNELTCRRCGRRKDINLAKYSDEDKLINEMEIIKAEEIEKERLIREKHQKQKAVKKQKTRKTIIYSSIIGILILILGFFTIGNMTEYTFSWDNYQMLNNKDNELIELVKDEKTEDIEFLINKGADSNYVNDKGENSIAEAIKNHNKSLVTLLLNNESESVKVGENDDSLVHVAISNEQFGILKELKELGFDMNSRNNKQSTLLSAAIKVGDVDIINYLIQDIGVDMEDIDDDKNNPIQVALLYQSKNKELLKSLFKLDIDFNKENKKGENTYISGVKTENMNVVKELFKKDLDINNLDGKLNSALHINLNDKEENTEFIQNLIDEGTKINGFNKNGYSPLYLAIINDKHKRIKKLLENDADINKITKDGKSASDVASENDNEKVEQIINEYNEELVAKEEKRKADQEKKERETKAEKEEGSNQKDLVINYTVTKDGFVDINPNLTEINLKLNQRVILKPTIEEGVTERVLIDSSKLDFKESKNMVAIQKGKGKITIIPNEYDWDNSVEITVNVN